MLKFIFTFVLCVCSMAANALTITLDGVVGNSCPYSTAATDTYGNIKVMCQPGWTGVGIASITKGHGNSCMYLSVITYNNGNIQGICSMSSAGNTTNSNHPDHPNHPNHPKVPKHAWNPDVCIDKKGMYAWVQPPNGL